MNPDTFFDAMTIMDGVIQYTGPSSLTVRWVEYVEAEDEDETTMVLVPKVATARNRAEFNDIVDRAFARFFESPDDVEAAMRATLENE